MECAVRLLALLAALTAATGCVTTPERPAEAEDDPHHDWDGDGYCEEDPCVEGYPGDCDDGDAAVHPGADEGCDLIDTNCDGELGDEEIDGDGDGSPACEDCDDGDPACFPGNDEICDGLDNDCDPATDEDADQDQDGFSLCDGDCDEEDDRTNPGMLDWCDGADNDCDGAADGPGCVACTAWVPTDHASIGDALEDAQDGAVICVEPGTYTETFALKGRPVRLTGIAGADRTVIDAGGAGPAITIDQGEGWDSVVERLTVQGGAAAYGGALYVVDSAPTLRQLELQDCSSEEEGGCVYLLDSSPTMEDLGLLRCVAGSAGGGMFLDGSSPSMARISISECEAGTVGGGMTLASASHPRLDVVWFMVNDAEEQGGGIRIRDGSDADLRNSLFLLNGAGEKGGAIAVQDSSPTLTNVLVAGNVADEGAGLRLRGDPTATLSNVIVAGNEGVDGAGLYLYQGASPTLTHVTLVGNEASGLGGALYIDLTATPTLSNTLIAHNQAFEGGAIYASGSNDGSLLTWSAMWDNGGDSSVIGFTFEPGAQGNLHEDPGFIDMSSWDPTTWDLHLSEGSLLVDAGDWMLADPGSDPCDIGAYGGTYAGSWDLDGDGFPQWWQPGAYDFDTYPAQGWDCDDQSASTHPGEGC
jgi:hypothetical protein